MSSRPIPNTKEIEGFLHCGLCLQEQLESDQEVLHPVEYQQIEVGFTELGLQVWCKRHDCNIVHIDFQGQRNPANTSRKVKP